MPTLATLGNILIRMYADDHNPPHFHVDTPDFRATIRIVDLEVHQGSLNMRTLRIVREWAEANRRLLETEWERLNERF